MITIYQRTLKQKNFKTVTQAKRGCWIAVEAPTPEELDLLTNDHGLERGHLTDALDPDEVPRSETEGQDVYIFTRVPILTGTTLITKPLLFILTPTLILTVSSERFAFFDTMLKKPKSIYTTQRIPFLIACFFEIIRSYNSSITNINRKLYKIRTRLDRIGTKQIIDFISYEEQMNDLLNSITRTNLILRTLLNGRTLPLLGHDKDLVEDLFLSTEQIITGAKNTLLTIRNTRDAHTALLTHDLNQVIKLFTSLTVILTVPTIISSFYGMNVPIPFQESPLAFAGIVSITVLLIAGLLYLFSKRHWL